MDPLVVKVRVRGGVVQDVEVPPGVVALVYDYDIDGTEEISERDETDSPCCIEKWGQS